MKIIGTYKPNSNIITSMSIKGVDIPDYLELRKTLQKQRISIGEYFMDCYRELDKDAVDVGRLKTLRMNR